MTLEHDDDRPGLGLLLAALQIASWFAFVACCAFSDRFTTTRIPDGSVPPAFLLGAGVIATGVVLTIVYVTATNRKGKAR
jgi:uncharacterized membrane protein (DUF485 family)